MTGLILIALAVVVLLGSGWWLSWLATRLDRAHARVDRRWSALDAALTGRAEEAERIALRNSLDEETRRQLCVASGAARRPGLEPHERETAESELSSALARTGLELQTHEDQVRLARRLYNDAVATAAGLRRHPAVSIFHLAGHAAQPRPFEMALFEPTTLSSWDPRLTRRPLRPATPRGAVSTPIGS
jgi:hypothetical protein